MRNKYLYCIKSRLAFILSCLATISASSNAIAAQSTWNGGAGNWSNTSFWSTGISPNSTDADVYVDGGKPVVSTVTVDGGFTVGRITISASDSVLIGNGEAFTVSDASGLGAIINNGNLTLNSAGSTTLLQLSGTIALSGSGVTTMNANSYIQGTGRLVNSSTIRGQGTLADGQIAITNSGLIDANVSSAQMTFAPIIDTNGVINTGIIQASAGGILGLQGNATGNFNNTGGTIQALAGSEVDLDAVYILSGSLNSVGTGKIVATANGGNYLDGATVNGNLDFSTSGNAQILNGLVLNGTANVDGGSIISFEETQALTGNATILFGAAASNRLAIDSSTTATLTLGPSALVHGENGIIGEPAFIGGTTKLINNGTISADVAGGTITLQPNSTDADSVSNAGTLSAINGATLLLEANVTNTGAGHISVTGSGSTVTQNGITITGGVISQSGSSHFTVIDNSSNFLDGVAFNGNLDLTNTGVERVLDGLVLNGTASINGSGILAFQETQALTGTATILFGSDTSNRLAVDSSSSASLTLAPGVLVHGENGSIGQPAYVGGSTNIVNNGVIAADVNGGTISLAPNSGALDSVSNAGTIKALNGGTLLLNADITNTGTGNIVVSGSGSTFSQNGNTITGGVISETGSGRILIGDNSSNILDGVTVNGNLDLTNTGVERVLDGLVLNGTASIDGNGILAFQETQALTGSATILLSSSPSNRVAIDSNSSATLTLGPGVLIHGSSGTIGQPAYIGGTTKLINNGTISADVAGGTITLVTNSPDPDSVDNSGLLQAINSGTLAIGANVTNTAAIRAGNGVGTSVLYLSGETITQTGTGAITISPGGQMQFNNGEVDGGTLTSATPVFFYDASNNILSSVNATLAGMDLSQTGVARILNGNLTLNGTANIDGNGILAFQETQALSGSATILFGSSPSNQIAIDSVGSATLTFGTGVLVHGENGVIGQPAFIGGTTKLVNNGVISADVAGGTIGLQPNSGTLDSVTNSGTLGALNGGTLDLNASITNTSSGRINVSGSGSVINQNGITITGGVINQTDPSNFIVATNGNNFFDGVAVNGNLNFTSTGEERVSNGLVLNGTASIDGNGILGFTETQALSGTATILFGASAANRIAIDSTSSAILTFGPSVLVHGQNGIIGQPVFIGGTVKLINNGTISADGTNGTITINPSSADPDTVNNTGLLQAANGGTLSIPANTTNSGTLEALDGSTITFQSSGLLANDSAGILTGGVYRAISLGGGATINLHGTPISDIAALTGVVLSGSGSLIEVDGIPLESSLVTNSGTLSIIGNRNFANTNGLDNPGVLQLGGGTFNAPSLTNDASAQIFGFGTITPRPASTGIIRATGGILAFGGGIQGTGTVQIDPGASLDLSAGGANSSANYLIHSGSNLNLGNNNILVNIDYTNAGFGTGNSFNPRANVTGAALILASGNVAQTLTVSGSTGVTMAFGNVHTGDIKNKTYSVNNAGTSGPVLRGALQTSVNGGNITDSRLSGSGVTASNWGPISTGSSTPAYTVVFTAASAGPLAGQVVHVINNFGNVAAQNLVITGTAYRYAGPSARTPNPVNFGNFHVGATAPTQFLTLSNTDANDGYSESLDAGIASPTGGVTTNSGTFSLLAAGGTNSTALSVGISTASVGIKNGTATITLTSDGTGTSGLGNTALGTQTVTVSGTVYRLAQASAHTPEPINFGNFHVGAAAPSQFLKLSNTAATDGFSESLDASIGSPTGGVTTNSGTFGLLAAGGTNSAALSVGISTASAGIKNGTATISLTSDGTGTSGLGTTSLASQTVNISGTVYRLAQASAHTPEPINFGNFHVGATAPAQLLTIANSDPNDGFSESLDAGIGLPTGGVTTNSGTFSLLAAGGTNSTALSVGISTASAGIKNGTATITLTSDGTGTSGLGTTALGTQTITVSGTVYRLAQASAHTPEPVNFGNFHVGATAPAQLLTIFNTAATDGFSESLDAGIGLPTGGVTTNSGTFSLLAAGGTNSAALSVGISTAAAGIKNGTATITLTSDGSGTSGLGITSLASQTVNISGTVYRLAQASAHTPEPVNFGNVHVGASPVQLLTISNAAATDGFSESLDAGIGSPTGGVTTNSGTFSLLAAGGTNSTALSVGISTAAAGIKNGTATITLTSDGTGTSGLGNTALGTQTVTVSATVYRLAQASAHTPEPINFGNFHVGATAPSQFLKLSNTAATDGFSESLDASIGSPTGGVTTNSGTFGLLAAGGTNSAALSVGISTASAGIKNGTATITLTSDGSGTSGLGITSLASQTVNVSGTVYRLAQASAHTPEPVNFGNFHVGATAPAQLLTIANSDPNDGFSESLDAGIGSPTGGVTTNSGAFSLLAAGGTNSTALSVGISTAAAGIKNGTATITLTSDGSGTSGLGTTSLASQTINVSGTVYRLAQASAHTPEPVSFGIVHVGDVVQQALTIANTAATDGFSEKLDAQFSSATTGITTSGTLGVLAAGGTNSSTLMVGVNTTIAGSISGTATLALTSDGAGTSGLGTTALASQSVTVSAQVNNFATPIFLKLSGNGTLTQTGSNSFTLNLGIVTQGSPQLQSVLEIENNVAGPADTLAGSFNLNAPSFSLSGFSSFNGVTAGQALSGFDVNLATAQPGIFSGTVTLLPLSQNTGGYDGSLGSVALTLQGQVIPEPSSYALLFAGGILILSRWRFALKRRIG